MTFSVGQEVVCVDDENWLNTDESGKHPVKGNVYTVAEWRTFRGTPAISLDEFACWHFYMARRFRPVKTTSIEIFRAMLVTPPREIVGA